MSVYRRNLRWMAALLRSEGILPVFVLQPILQPGVKPLAPAEAVIINRLGTAAEGVIALYPLARAAIHELDKADPTIVALDYAEVFADVPEQMYFDDVHFLPEGNRLIAERLADDIAEAWAR